MNKRMVIGIIPARHASTRLPAKPLLDLGGKPMIRHVYEQAREAKLIDMVIVATDHDDIANAVRHFGGNAVMTPPELKSGSDRAAFAASSLPDAGVIVNIQGDEPLIVPAMIDQAISPVLEDPSVHASTLVRVIKDYRDVTNPSVVKVVIDDSGYALYFSRSPIPHVRDIPEAQWHTHHTYYKHIGLYVYDRETLIRFANRPESPLEKAEKLEQLRLLSDGVRIKTVITEFDSLPVDTAEDAQRVRTILRSKT